VIISSLQDFDFTLISLSEIFAVGDWKCHFEKNALKLWNSIYWEQYSSWI